MKKIYIVILAILLSISYSYAGSEEEACFVLLNQAIKNDSRFTDSNIFVNGDLSEVLYDESNNSYHDFSDYSGFRQRRAENPGNVGNGIYGDEYYFEARRNNIGTIISGNNYIISQISGFGKDSNFDFPLESKFGLQYGDKYVLRNNYFKEYVLYTHHLNSFPYDLLSCGIVRVMPLGERSFSDINESGYMTNILNGAENQPRLGNRKCASGFEGAYREENGEDFYQMKANVCVQDYNEDDYLKLEVISLAYDNGSTRLNEYLTNPMQVEAMRDNSNNAGGLKGIQDAFRTLLVERTCFSVVHGRKSNLPSACNNDYQSNLISAVTNNIFTKLQEMFIPKGWAALDVDEKYEGFSGEDTGIMVYGNLPLKLYNKLESIPDEQFREYLLMSILPNFDEIISYRKENNILLSPYEEVFASCEIDYQERMSIIQDFLEELDVENFSLANLSYSNKKFGDCIVPYPDKENLATVVEGSFLSNQVLAQKIAGTYNNGEVSLEMQEFIAQRNKILAEYNKALVDADSQFNAGEISASENFELKQNIQIKFEEALNNFTLDSDELEDVIISTQQDNDLIKSPDSIWTKVGKIGLVILFIGTGLVLIITSYILKNKNINTTTNKGLGKK